METVAFCEIEEYPRKVLQKHWPEVPIYEDVRELTSDRLRQDGITVDLICGGFPCQDVSLAGCRQGLGETRSGLWSEFSRLVGEIRPSFVLVENTPGLLSLGMDRVLGDLAELRYDAEWYCIPACAIGADHQRDRIWIIAYVAGWDHLIERRSEKPSGQMAKDAAGFMRPRLQGGIDAGKDRKDAPIFRQRIGLALNASTDFPREYRSYRPVLGRGVHGIRHRMDRIKALGNAVVPQIPEIIGRAILENENRS